MGLWNKGTDSLHAMLFVNNGASFYLQRPLDKFPQVAYKEKKNKYLVVCIQQHWYFSPCVFCFCGSQKKEAETTLKRIVIHLTEKWWKLYSRMCRYVKSRVAIIIVQVTHYCILG